MTYQNIKDLNNYHLPKLLFLLLKSFGLFNLFVFLSKRFNLGPLLAYWFSEGWKLLNGWCWNGALSRLPKEFPKLGLGPLGTGASRLPKGVGNVPIGPVALDMGILGPPLSMNWGPSTLTSLSKGWGALRNDDSPPIYNKSLKYINKT